MVSNETSGGEDYVKIIKSVYHHKNGVTHKRFDLKTRYSTPRFHILSLLDDESTDPELVKWVDEENMVFTMDYGDMIDHFSNHCVVFPEGADQDDIMYHSSAWFVDHLHSSCEHIGDNTYRFTNLSTDVHLGTTPHFWDSHFYEVLVTLLLEETHSDVISFYPGNHPLSFEVLNIDAFASICAIAFGCDFSIQDVRNNLNLCLDCKIIKMGPGLNKYHFVQSWFIHETQVGHNTGDFEL